MKSQFAFFFLALLFLVMISCEKEDVPHYIRTDFGDSVLQSYTSSYTAHYVDGTYFAYIPESNEITGSIDIDNDLADDFIFRINHYLFSTGPHYYYTSVKMTVSGVDSTAQVSVGHEPFNESVMTFSNGDHISSDSLFSAKGYIVRDVPYTDQILKMGELILGIRKILPDGSERYGYLEIKSEKAKITIRRSVYNANKGKCQVGG